MITDVKLTVHKSYMSEKYRWTALVTALDEDTFEIHTSERSAEGDDAHSAWDAGCDAVNAYGTKSRAMSKATEAAKLARTLRRLGFTVELKNGHYRVSNRHGHLLVTFSSSPSDFF